VESADTDILVIYLDVKSTVNPDVNSSTIESLSVPYNCVLMVRDVVVPTCNGLVREISFSVQDREVVVSDVIDDAKNTALVEVRLWHVGTQLDEPVTLLLKSVGKYIMISEVELLLISLESYIFIV
jgi:hypothetical protein